MCVHTVRQEGQREREKEREGERERERESLEPENILAGDKITSA